MLRSLDMDKDSSTFGQPKPRDKMSPGELDYVDRLAPQRERERTRLRARRDSDNLVLDQIAKRLNEERGDDAE